MQGPASDCVRVARANVRLATQICGKADRASLERAFILLQATVNAMHRAEAEVRSRPPDDPAGLGREIGLLKREIAGMLRVIDGCAAVCRGLSMRLGRAAPGYTPQGQAVAAPAVPTACELQG